MQVELKIKEILAGHVGVERKADEICQFMDWNKKKLIEAILKHGTSGSKRRTSIVGEFWNKKTLNNIAESK